MVRLPQGLLTTRTRKHLALGASRRASDQADRSETSVRVPANISRTARWTQPAGTGALITDVAARGDRRSRTVPSRPAAHVDLRHPGAHPRLADPSGAALRPTPDRIAAAPSPPGAGGDLARSALGQHEPTGPSRACRRSRSCTVTAGRPADRRCRACRLFVALPTYIASIPPTSGPAATCLSSGRNAYLAEPVLDRPSDGVLAADLDSPGCPATRPGRGVLHVAAGRLGDWRGGVGGRAGQGPARRPQRSRRSSPTLSTAPPTAKHSGDGRSGWSARPSRAAASDLIGRPGTVTSDRLLELDQLRAALIAGRISRCVGDPRPPGDAATRGLVDNRNHDVEQDPRLHYPNRTSAARATEVAPPPRTPPRPR